MTDETPKTPPATDRNGSDPGGNPFGGLAIDFGGSAGAVPLGGASPLGGVAPIAFGSEAATIPTPGGPVEGEDSGSRTESKVVIVGSGPAGLTAAIYAARANLAPIVLAGSAPAAS